MLLIPRWKRCTRASAPAPVRPAPRRTAQQGEVVARAAAIGHALTRQDIARVDPRAGRAHQIREASGPAVRAAGFRGNFRRLREAHRADHGASFEPMAAACRAQRRSRSGRRRHRPDPRQKPAPPHPSLPPAASPSFGRGSRPMVNGRLPANTPAEGCCSNRQRWSTRQAVSRRMRHARTMPRSPSAPTSPNPAAGSGTAGGSRVHAPGP